MTSSTKMARRSVLAGGASAVLLAVGGKARAQTDSVKLGWVKSTANLAAFIAPELSGHHGLTIQPENFNTAVDIVTALANGHLDVGLLTPIHLIRAVESNLNLVQVCGNVRGNTGIVIAKKYNLAKDDWDGLKKLLAQKKLRVASSRGSVNETLALAEFPLHGIDVEKQLDWVNIANFGQHPQALRSGEFDMIVTLEPLVAISISQGIGTLFSFPYGSPAGDLNTNFCVRADWLEKNRGKVQKFVNTIVAAARQLDASKQANLDAAVRLTGLDPKVAEQALANSKYDVRNGLAQMQALAKLAAANGFTQRDVSADLPKFVDASFLKAAGVAE